MPTIVNECIALVQKNIDQPLKAYEITKGPIKYTQAERTEWEKKMKERFAK